MLQGTARTLADADLQQVVGGGAQDQHGKGNTNAGDRGIAFILASAGYLPGGSGVVSPNCARHCIQYEDISSCQLSICSSLCSWWHWRDLCVLLDSSQRWCSPQPLTLKAPVASRQQPPLSSSSIQLSIFSLLSSRWGVLFLP